MVLLIYARAHSMLVAHWAHHDLESFCQEQVWQVTWYSPRHLQNTIFPTGCYSATVMLQHVTAQHAILSQSHGHHSMSHGNSNLHYSATGLTAATFEKVIF